MHKNERVFWDATLVPDSLARTLDQFKTGKLPSTLARAATDRSGHVRGGLIADRLREVEDKAKPRPRRRPAPESATDAGVWRTRVVRPAVSNLKNP